MHESDFTDHDVMQPWCDGLLRRKLRPWPAAATCISNMHAYRSTAWKQQERSCDRDEAGDQGYPIKMHSNCFMFDEQNAPRYESGVSSPLVGLDSLGKRGLVKAQRITLLRWACESAALQNETSGKDAAACLIYFSILARAQKKGSDLPGDRQGSESTLEIISAV